MQLLVTKLQRYIPLTAEECAAIGSMPFQTQEIAARQEMPVSSGVGGSVHLIMSGYVCRYKILPDGRRQILSFLVAGDLSDLRLFILGQSDLSVATLSSVSVAIIPRSAILRLTERFPRITRALWWATLVEESITQEWLVNVGQRTALERMAHLMCELHTRLAVVGCVDGQSFDLPITQSELADTLGLSTVHVNRTIQQLKRINALAINGRKVELLDAEKLRSIAMFSPDYLHLRPATGASDDGAR